MEPESNSPDESCKRLRDWENELSTTDARVQWKRARGDVFPPSIPAMASISVEGSSYDPFGVERNTVNVPQSELESTEMEWSDEPLNAIAMSRLIGGENPDTPEVLERFLEGEISFDKDKPFDSRGHFCDVFLGTHASKGQVALKRLRQRDENVAELARHETNIWMGLDHDHILKCLGVFTRDGHLYMVSPYMKNGNLFDWIRSGELSGQERLRLIRELAEALAYLHASRHVHGDVKANNVLLSNDFHIQLCDFGLTKLVDSSTLTGLKGAGSARWRSPELWDGAKKTFESDVYAFSITIAEVLTGQLPFAEMNESSVMRAVIIDGKRPECSPKTSSDGFSYANAWDVARQCWPTLTDRRISMEQAVNSLNVYSKPKGQDISSIRTIPDVGTGHDTLTDDPSTTYGIVSDPGENLEVENSFYNVDKPINRGYFGKSLNRKRPRGVGEILPDPKRRCLGPVDLEAQITFDNIDEPINSRGHFSDLYLGTHRTRGRVALKRLRGLGTSELDEGALELLFCKEAEIWMKLRHDRILECLGSFKRRGYLYFVSPFMAKGTLFDWIKPENHGTERLRLISELSDALGYIHAENILHGDVTAQNILLSDDLHVQLCGFGLAKVAATRTHTRLRGAGSFRWQSPELWNNEPKTFKSDVYAFAMTIVEVVTGKVPFPDLIHDSHFLMAIYGRKERPAKVPLVAPDGTSYATAWDVAEKCWPQEASERISMETAAELLRHDAHSSA